MRARLYGGLALFLCLLFSALLFEEGLHEFAAVGFEDAGGDRGLGMESTRGDKVIASLIILTAIDDAGDLRPSDGAGTHGAGLDGDVEGAVGEVLATKGVGSGGDGLHLGMGSDIAEGLREVVGTRDDAVLAYHHGTNRYLAGFEGSLGLVECHTHVAFVFFLLLFVNHVAKIVIFWHG